MKASTTRHLKSSVTLIGAGAVVMPLLGALIGAVAEATNNPLFKDWVESYLGVGTFISLLVLTLVYRLLAVLVNQYTLRNVREDDRPMGSVGRSEATTI